MKFLIKLLHGLGLLPKPKDTGKPSSPLISGNLFSADYTTPIFFMARYENARRNPQASITEDSISFDFRNAKITFPKDGSQKIELFDSNFKYKVLSKKGFTSSR
jgi:hypothetical protein